MNYYKQLDFLRFFAVSLVILQHWFKLGSYFGIDIGRIGVLIFFTLSGFLITKILLHSKTRIDEGRMTLGRSLKYFYLRRLLRISPIYYILIFSLFVLSFENLKEKFIWYFLYGSNFYVYIKQQWDGLIGPLWSLAVEEQFYLFWPFIVLTIRRKSLKLALWACVLLGVILRVAFIFYARYKFENANDSISAIVLMPTCIDCFGWGGLLSYYMLIENKKWEYFVSSNIFFLFVLISSTLVFLVSENLFILIFYPTTVSILSVLVIHRLLIERKGWVGKIINYRPFLYLGKISYGLYLYHGPFPFIFGTIDFILSKINSGISIYESLGSLNVNYRLGIWVIYLIIFSSISYYFIEKPINKLKEKFTYY